MTILAKAATGGTLYAVLLDEGGQAYRAGHTAEAPASAHWADYALAMTEASTTGIYSAAMPAVAAGVYSFLIYRQAGVSPAVGDACIGSGAIRWTGTDEEGPGAPVTLASEQPAITWGQQKISANVMGEGALHIENTALGGSGVYKSGTAYGEYTEGATGEYVVANTGIGVRIDGVTDGVRVTGDTVGILADNMLSSQAVRDAMKLAPSTGAPSAGSVDTHLDDLLVTLAAATTSLTVVSAVDGGTITIYRAVTLDATLAGLTIPADYDTVYWTVKTDADLPDTVSTIQVNSDDGLIYLNRAAPADSDLGSITVNQGAGTIGLYLSEEATALLSRTSSLVYSLKALSPAGAMLLAVGVVVVRAQATEALS